MQNTFQIKAEINFAQIMCKNNFCFIRLCLTTMKILLVNDFDEPY